MACSKRVQRSSNSNYSRVLPYVYICILILVFTFASLVESSTPIGSNGLRDSTDDSQYTIKKNGGALSLPLRRRITPLELVNDPREDEQATLEDNYSVRIRIPFRIRNATAPINRKCTCNLLSLITSFVVIIDTCDQIVNITWFFMPILWNIFVKYY